LGFWQEGRRRLSLDASRLYASACLRCLSLTYDDDMYMWFLIETLLPSCMTCVIETFGDADRCDGKKLYVFDSAELSLLVLCPER
jgi:hypothetical protein